ncbi:MAG: WGR domain-containing protein [Candidatus Kerfeldbacteria bacterium]|nr:WGR domain-containing protein [Candidatus Kerfeldbacteria bacterium]
MERYEFRTETSSKFWEPMVKGNVVTVRFGKIGTAGQAHTKTFSSPMDAAAGYQKLVCEKLAKGYKPTSETVGWLLQHAAPDGAPVAIGSLYIGEHVPDEVIQDICGWATACLQHGMTLEQFRNVWDRFLTGEDEELENALGETLVEVSELSSPIWLDVTDWSEGELYELYAKAVESGGDRFIWFDNNAYIDIVALRGDPGARAIEVCVLDEKNCQDENGEWLDNWSDELGPGAPIASMSCSDVMLRDGRRCSLGSFI